MRRALKITAWTAGSLLLLIAGLIAAVVIAGNTVGGRRLIEHETAALTGGHVRLAGLAGAFPQSLDLQQLKLSDEHGVWLSAERIALRWSPAALLRWHVQVASLRVAHLDVERGPVSEPQKSPSRSRLPRIDVGQLSVGELVLGPQLAGIRALIAVHGSAHLISLEDAAASIVARRTDGMGEYTLNLRFDPSQMDASLKIEESAGGPLVNLLKYPGLGALSVIAKLNGPRRAERVQVTATAGDLRADAQGSIDLEAKSADLTYDVDAGAMTPRPGLAWQSIALHGRWRGAFAAPQAEGRLQIHALQIPGGVELAALSANLSGDSGALTVHATADGLTLPGPQPRVLADAPIRMEATVQLNAAARPLQLTAEHPLFALQGRALTSGAQNAALTLHLPDLAPLAALAGQSMRGKSDLHATVEEISTTTTRFNLEARSELAQPVTLLSRMLGGTSHLRLAALLTDRTLEIERLNMNASALSLSASGTAQRGATSTAPAFESLRARYEVDLSNLSLLSTALAGAAKVSGKVDGPMKSLAADLQVTSTLSVRESPRETIRASITARGLPALASATLQAQGQLGGAPLTLDAALERATGDAFHLVVHNAQWKSARIEGDLTTAADLTPGRGSASVRMEHLADLQPLLGTKLEGSIAGGLTLKAVAGHTETQLRLDAQNIVAGSLSSANARLNASGPADALSVQLAVQSAALGGEPASLDTAGRLNVVARELGLQRAEAHYHGQSLRLLSPARLSFADGLAVRDLKLGAQRAVLQLDGRVSPALDLRGSVHQVDAALVNAFVPNVLAKGTLDLDAQLKGTPSAPTGLLSFKASGLRLGSSTARDLAAVDVHGTAKLLPEGAQIDARLSAGSASQLSLTGTAPLSASGAMNLKLTGSLAAELANPLLEARGERAAGVFAVNATLSGTAQAPEIGGTIDLSHGDLRDYPEGVHLADMAAHVVAEQGTLRIASLTARAPPGELSMTGTVAVLQPKIPIDLHLSVKNAQPIASDLLNANLNAELKAQGTLRERIDLSGKIDLHRTVVGIPNSLPPEVAVLDVRRPGQAPPTPAEARLVINLDLSLHAPREILVQGRGLNAELGGDLHIGGTSDSPRVAGGFDLIRGTFSLASSQLTFTKGTVSFDGAGLQHKIDPTLDFTAQTTVADATTTLRITGRADSPQFDLSSTPQLPQDEILARLLFGESAAQLTALQIAQIGAALATLSGAGGGGPNPLAKMQKRLGLDRLSVGGGSSNAGTPGAQNTGASVEAGRYVSNRVFVGAKQSTTGFSQVQVDVDLSKHLKLQTRLGNGTATTQGTTPENDPGSSVGLMYQFEY